MWDKREKSTIFRSEDNNFYSIGSEFSYRENKGLAHPNYGPDDQFMAETSRKRKATDSDLVNNVYDRLSPRFPVNHSGNFERMLPRESSSQHNVVAMDSHWKTPEMFSDHNSQSAKPSNALSQSGNYQFYNRNNSLMTLQGRDENFQDVAVDSSKSCTFLYKEPSFLIKAPAGGLTKLPDLRNPAFDIGSYSEASNFRSHYYKQSGDSMDKTQAALRSNNDMNSRLGNNYLPSTPAMPMQNLTFLNSSQLRMINEEFNPGGGTYMQDFRKSGQVEVKKSGQNIGFSEDNPICTTNCGQTSVKDGKEGHGFYQYSNTEIRSTNYPFNDILGAHRNVSGTDMLQIPVLTESSGQEDACVDNGMLENMGHVSKDLETETLEKEDGSNNENKYHSLGEGTSPETDNTHARRPVELSDGPSLNLDEQSKPVAAKISPVIVEKLWDGSLQLNTSTVVSTVAFFKSGEKAQDINWSEHIEIKGKVRLQAFEKFIQELPRSRNRALMVISLCWKVGSSRAGLTGMKEVSKGYRQSERVGFAQICPGIDLYVCPRSDTIITILAKYGFFKGMAAVEEDHDSLIGCVVWRRGNTSSNSIPQKSERKKVPEQTINSPESSVVETNSPLTTIHDSESKQATPFTGESDGVPSQFVSETRSTDLDDARDRTTESKGIQSSNNLRDVSSHHTDTVPVPAPTPCTSSPVPIQLNPELTSLRETMEHVAIPIMQIGEPRNPDKGSESTQPVFPGPPPKLPDIQPRNTQSSKDLHSHRSFHTGHTPELNPHISFNSLMKQVQPSATQWPYSSSRQDPTESVSRAGTQNAELKKSDMGSELKQPLLPGPPQLPPEVLQRMIQASRNAHQDPMHITEPKRASMVFEPTGPTIPRAPQSLPQSRLNSADPDDEDDLPEFDFSSASGVPESAVSKFPWWGHQSPSTEAQQFGKQPPIEMVKNVGGPMPPLMPMLRSTEVTQRSKASSLPEELFSAYQGISLPTRFGELRSEKELEHQASQSLRPSSTFKADKGAPSSKSGSNFRQKNRWDDDDDDDDMPEWCPPALEHHDPPQPSTTTRLPSPIRKPASENGPPRPPIPAQSPTSFRQPQSQGLPSGYQPGLLGPHPAAFMQTRPAAAGFIQTETRPTMLGPNPNHSLGPRVSKFDGKSPSDANWRRWRRP